MTASANYQIIYNHEPMNYLGPFSLLEEGFETLEQAQERAREIAEEADSPNRKCPGVGIMVRPRGRHPRVGVLRWR